MEEYLFRDMKLKSIKSTKQIEVYDAVQWVNDKPAQWTLLAVYDWIHEPKSRSDLFRQYDILRSQQ